MGGSAGAERRVAHERYGVARGMHIPSLPYERDEGHERCISQTWVRATKREYEKAMENSRLNESPVWSDFRHPVVDKPSDKSEVLAIIPARGGSKGIPRKNLQFLGGKPLIAYSIEVALAASNIDRVIVSTDDEEIAEVAQAFGAEVPILRPEGLAKDSSVIPHALKHMRSHLFCREGYMPDVQVVMYPTHPFRTVSRVEHIIRQLVDNQFSTVVTYKRILPKMGGFLVYDRGRLQNVGDRNSVIPTAYYRSYGYLLVRSLSLQTCGNYSHVLTNEIEFVDIDEWDDLAMARRIISMGLYDFEIC